MNLKGTDRIIYYVTQEFAVTKSELFSRARPDRIAFPRHVLMTLLYDTYESSIHVGKIFHTDHTTVLYARSAVRDRCDTNRKAREQVNRLREQFGLEPYRCQ